MPPGPPVLSTLLAEVYGPDAASRRALASKVRKAFEAVDFVVDVDDSFGVPAERLRFAIDQEALEFHGVEEQAVYDTIGALIGGAQVGYSQRGGGLKPIDINVALPRSGLALERAHPLDAAAGRRHARARAPMWNSATSSAVKRERASYPIFRHNGRFAEMVQRRTRRTLRGADLRHARGRRRDRQDRLGRGRHAATSRITASRSTSRARRCCGTANGRSPMSRSATWARPSASRSSASICSSSRSSARSSCRWSS